MSISAIVQVAEQTNVGKIDGIFQIASCVNNLYDEVNIKGKRFKFEKAALKHLNITKAATYIWLKIYNNKMKLIKYKSNLPVNINCLDVIASMSEEEIKEGISSGAISNSSISVYQLRQYQHSLESYKKRNANSIKIKKILKVKKEQEKELAIKEQEKVKEDFDIQANKDKECLYEDIELKLKFMDQKCSDIMNKFQILRKDNEELKFRLDLMQKLLMKM